MSKKTLFVNWEIHYMSKMKIVDIRIMSPCGAITSRPIFNFERTHTGISFLSHCSSEFKVVSLVKEVQVQFRGGLRTAWSEGRPHDTRPLNQPALSMLNWRGEPKFAIHGDVAILMPNKLWPQLRINCTSDDMRAALEAVGMNDVAVLPSRFLRNQSDCLIAAPTISKLTMAKLAAPW
mgnify:CR=1 FL=1